MFCRRCQHLNPEGSKFCNQCGEPLIEHTVALTLDRGQHGIAVRFSAPISSTPERRAWITVLEAESAESAYGTWQYVEDGATEVVLSSPTSPGRYEVRLHDDYPARPFHVVARESFEVEFVARPATPVRFTLDAQEVGPGEPIRVRFERPVPSSPTSRYWITVINAWESDDTYGAWCYVEDGAREIQLTAPPTAGDFEVRLYSEYPRLTARLAQRAPIDVRSRDRNRPAPPGGSIN